MYTIRQNSFFNIQREAITGCKEDYICKVEVSRLSNRLMTSAGLFGKRGVQLRKRETMDVKESNYKRALTTGKNTCSNVYPIPPLAEEELRKNVEKKRDSCESGITHFDAEFMRVKR